MRVDWVQQLSCFGCSTRHNGSWDYRWSNRVTNYVDYRNECVHPQASGTLSLLEKYLEHESSFLIIDHLLMKLEETYELLDSGHRNKATVCPTCVQVKN